MTERMMLIGILAKAAAGGHSLETRVETEQLADYLIANGVRMNGGVDGAPRTSHPTIRRNEDE